MIKQSFFSILFAALIWGCAMLRVVFTYTPVPATMQLVPVLIAGAVLGAKKGAFSCLIYIALGLFRLPVFSGGASGIEHIFGSNGGFVMGFVLCSFVTGILVKKYYQSYGTFFLKWAAVVTSMSAGTVVLYLCGLIHFYVFTGYALQKTLILSITPFIWIDLIKIFISAYASCLLLQWTNNDEIIMSI